MQTEPAFKKAPFENKMHKMTGEMNKIETSNMTVSSRKIYDQMLEKIGKEA